MSAGPAKRRLPRASYRVQLHKGFGFRDAAELVDYLDDLGISHLYTSPIMAARAGSTHGYDVIDHNRLNPELGTEADFDALVEKLHAQGMGLIVDIVPNHVGIGPDNVAWMDVLEWGQRSPFAHYFDIDWHSSRRNLEGKVLLPVLGDQFGVVLERGEIALRLDRDQGSISAWYYDNRLPISPLHYARLLEPALKGLDGAPARRLATLARDFATLTENRDSNASLRDGAAGLKVQLAEIVRDEPAAAEAVERALAGFSGRPGDIASWQPLGELLDEQSYRAAYWRVSSDEINYRRFFDINDLAGLRVELPELFEATHRTVFRLIDEGKIDGLRVDHVDGLFDPRGYARRLQAAAGAAQENFYIVLEKILAHYEDLPEDWPVAGTTGYDTLNLIGGLFVDPDAERALSTLYRRYTRRGSDFDALLHECKKLILQNNLASEVGVLANAVQTLSASQWRSRDFTYAAIRRALEELIARFPVYRTYLDSDGVLSAADRRYIGWAVGLAKKHAGPVETSVFDFLHQLLTGDLAGERSPYPAQAVRLAAMRFQQLSGPAMAKGLEDTAFYRHFRLIVHNEVGGDPRRWAVTPAAFHRANEQRLQRHPHDMLAGTTHDTKRGEDARARIACLSGLVKEWGERVSFWSRANRRLLVEVDGAPAPERNHEYYFYQTLIGAWPVELAPDDVDGLARFAGRVEAAMLKAVREGKERSSWTHPHAEYERAVCQFVRGALDARGPNPFLPDFQAFALRVAQLGALTSASQTLLRLTMPGVPDVYRGAESWELSMVDPDNRLPVDYAQLRQRFASLRQLFPDDRVEPAKARMLLENWQDGRFKLHLVRSTLRLRAADPELFARGDYAALEARGEQAALLLAFRRRLGERELTVVAPRLWPRLLPQGASRANWRNTALALAPGAHVDVLSGRRIEGGAEVPLAGLLDDFPVALLLRG